MLHPSTSKYQKSNCALEQLRKRSDKLPTPYHQKITTKAHSRDGIYFLFWLNRIQHKDGLHTTISPGHKLTAWQLTTRSIVKKIWYICTGL